MRAQQEDSYLGIGHCSSVGNESASTLILNFPTPKTIRNKFLLFISYTTHGAEQNSALTAKTKKTSRLSSLQVLEAFHINSATLNPPYTFIHSLCIKLLDSELNSGK